MHPVAAQFLALSKADQKRVHIALCRRAHALWHRHVSERGPVSYRESVTGSIQRVELELPAAALDAVEGGDDDTSIRQRYLEPIVAMQDEDLSWSNEMDLGYYAIYNLYRFHITGEIDDAWLIVSQALSALGEDDAVGNLLAACRT